MTREHKLALIIGFSLVLVVGVLISDHFSKAHEARVKSELPETPARNLAVDGLRPVGATPSNPGGSIFGPASASAQVASNNPNSVLPPVHDPMAERMAPQQPEQSITMGGGVGGNRYSASAPESGKIAVEIPRGFEPSTLMSNSTRPIGEPDTGAPTQPLPNMGDNGNGNAMPPTTLPGEVRPIRPDGPTVTPIKTVMPSPTPSSTPAKEEMVNGVPLKLCTRHDVQEGESMYRIAKDKYGDGSLWTKLKDYNKGKVMDNGSMRQGVTLLLPPKEALLGKPLPTTLTDNTVKPTNIIAPPSSPQINDPKAPVRTAQPERKDNKNTEKAIAANTPRTYTVVKGDDLSNVSRKTLGTSKRWMEIHDLNKDALDDEDSLVVGMVLKLPAR